MLKQAQSTATPKPLDPGPSKEDVEAFKRDYYEPSMVAATKAFQDSYKKNFKPPDLSGAVSDTVGNWIAGDYNVDPVRKAYEGSIRGASDIAAADAQNAVKRLIENKLESDTDTWDALWTGEHSGAVRLDRTSRWLAAHPEEAAKYGLPTGSVDGGRLAEELKGRSPEADDFITGSNAYKAMFFKNFNEGVAKEDIPGKASAKIQAQRNTILKWLALAGGGIGLAGMFMAMDGDSDDDGDGDEEAQTAKRHVPNGGLWDGKVKYGY